MTYYYTGLLPRLLPLERQCNGFQSFCHHNEILHNLHRLCCLHRIMYIGKGNRWNSFKNCSMSQNEVFRTCILISHFSVMQILNTLLNILWTFYGLFCVSSRSCCCRHVWPVAVFKCLADFNHFYVNYGFFLYVYKMGHEIWKTVLI